MSSSPANRFLPPVFQALSPRLWELSTGPYFQGQVLIVGAGLAGLTAAYMLKQQGLRPIILEAKKRPAGRLANLRNWADMPLELGAEWLHGQRSTLFRWLDGQYQSQIVEDEGEEFVPYKQQLRALEDYPGAEVLLERLNELGYEEAPTKGNLLDWAEQNGIDQALYPLLEYWAGEWGCSAKELGIEALAKINGQWSSGDLDFKAEPSLYDLIDESLIRPLRPYLQLGQAVKHIDYSGEQIKVFTQDQTIVVDKLLLTVPLPVLQKESISFVPNLPSAKTAAIQRLKMGDGLKIFFKFNRLFWSGDIIGSKMASSYIDTQAYKSGKDAILCAWAFGEKAEILRNMGQELASRAILAELDSLYVGAASSHFEKYYWQDWSQEEHIWGAYSYPSNSEAPGDRAELQAPIDYKLYFAGEACHPRGHIQSLHGAFETGYEAALQILMDLNVS